MKLQGNITISRHSGDKITVRFEDKLSCIEFVSAEIELDDFSRALTGLGHVPVTLSVNSLRYVGKRHEQEDREIVCPLKTSDRKKLEEWLIKNAQEPAWILDPYLGSQRSVDHLPDGKVKLRYSVCRYVDLPVTPAVTTGEGE